MRVQTGGITAKQKAKLREVIAKASNLDGCELCWDADGISIERDGMVYATFPHDCEPMGDADEAYNKQVKYNAWLFLSCRSVIAELLDELEPKQCQP